MSEYLKKIVTEYEEQLNDATSEKEEDFWRGAVFAMKIAVATAQSYGE